MHEDCVRDLFLEADDSAEDFESFPGCLLLGDVVLNAHSLNNIRDRRRSKRVSHRVRHCCSVDFRVTLECSGCCLTSISS